MVEEGGGEVYRHCQENLISKGTRKSYCAFFLAKCFNVYSSAKFLIGDEAFRKFWPAPL